jgi:hypothetical protein
MMMIRTVGALVVFLGLFSAAACGGRPQQVKSGVGQPCSVYTDCEPLLYCVEDTCVEADQAQRAGAEGQACQYDIQCMPPLMCLMGTCHGSQPLKDCTGPVCAY